jgi:PAS domain S-box-containing protein
MNITHLKTPNKSIIRSMVRSKSISKDLVISLVMVVVAVSIITNILNYWMMTINSDTLYHQKAQEYLDTLKNNMELPLWDYGEETVQKIGNSFVKNEFVAKLKVYNDQNKIVFEFDKGDTIDPVVYKTQVFSSGKITGTIELNLTPKVYQEANNQFLKSSLITMIVVTIILGLVTRLLLKILMGRPLDHLIKRIDRIASGDYKNYVQKYEQTEIQAIISRFDHMAREVEKRELSLLEVNKQLEQEVEYRKEAEAAYRESEERFRSIFENTTIGMNITTLDRKYSMVNPAFCSMLGYSKEELLSSTVTDITHPNDQEMNEKIFHKLINGPKDALNFIKRFLCSDDKVVWAATGTFLLRNAEQQPQHFINYVQDITQLKIMKDNLRHAQKMEAIVTMAGGIAHDFNNILSAITGNAEIAKYHELDGDHPAQYSIEQIIAASERAAALVQQLLTFSHQKEQKLSDINIIPVVKEVVKLLKRTLEENVTIELNHTSQVETITANPGMIHQVLMNLCNNAIHSMRTEGGVLRIDISHTQFSQDDCTKFQFINPGPYVKLNIVDSGEGMDDSFIDRIFEPYFTSKDIGEGKGLGLAVVHGIVRELKGEVTVTSRPGKGTTFTVLLPKVLPHEKQNLGIEQFQIHQGHETILFVDDEIAQLDVVKRLLGGIGYDVIVFTSGIKALESFSNNPHKYDLVITDLTMPGMTGDQLISAIRKINSKVPIILYSGYGNRISEEKIKKLDIQDFLLKPLKLDQFTKAIRKVLDQAK